MHGSEASSAKAWICIEWISVQAAILAPRH